MTNALLNLIEKYRPEHTLIDVCQLAMQQLYPQLLLRWSRIYGSRWAYLAGSNADTSCLTPTRIKISSEYGICIDNVDVISATELTDILQTLEVCFAYARTES